MEKLEDDNIETLLLMIAMNEEAEPLVSKYSLDIISSKDKQKVYLNKKRNIILGISGVLEHNMVSLASKLIGDYNPTQILNFGSAGAKIDSDINLGFAYFVDKSKKWDQDIPFDGFEWDQRDFNLIIPENEIGKGCLTGSRFSNDTDVLPQGELEDMELYGLVSLAEQHNLPISSIKYVTNFTGSNAESEFLENLIAARSAGIEKLETVLDIYSI